jgi:hypothetical protein
MLLIRYDPIMIGSLHKPVSSIAMVDWSFFRRQATASFPLLFAGYLGHTGRVGWLAKSAGDQQPDPRTRRALLHLSYSYALPVLMAAPVTTLEVTLTETVQICPAPTEASAREIVVPPSGAVSVGPTGPGLGLQVVDALAGVAMKTSKGRLSVKARSVTGAGPALLSIVKVSVAMLPGPMVPGEKALEKAGAASCALALSTGMPAAMAPRKKATIANACLGGFPPLFANKHLAPTAVGIVFVIHHQVDP